MRVSWGAGAQRVDESWFQDIRTISAAGAEESLALRQMADDATLYLSRFPWCPPILRGWLADGAGGIIALFLFEFTKPMQNGDRRLWVVVGDFPRACVRVLAEDSPHAAIERYVGLLERWINKVMIFDAASWNEFPLELEPSLRQAKLLRLKIDFLRQEVLPLLE